MIKNDKNLLAKLFVGENNAAVRDAMKRFDKKLCNPSVLLGGIA